MYGVLSYTLHEMEGTQVRQNSCFPLQLHVSAMTSSTEKGLFFFLNFTFMESLSSLTCKAIADVGTMEFSVHNYFISFPISPCHLTEQKRGSCTQSVLNCFCAK